MKYLPVKIHLSGKVTRVQKENIKPPAGGWDGTYSYDNCKPKLWTISKALVNAYENNPSWHSALVTLTFPDEYDVDKRFQFRRRFIDAMRKFFDKNNSELFYLSTTECTLKGLLHFHYAIMYNKKVPLTKWVLSYGTKKGHPNMIDNKYVYGSKKFGYVIKYISKSLDELDLDYAETGNIDKFFTFDRIHLGTDRMKAIYKAYLSSNLRHKSKLWTAKIPYRKVKEVLVNQNDLYVKRVSSQIFNVYCTDHYKFLLKKEYEKPRIETKNH